VKKVLLVNQVNPGSIIPQMLTGASYDVHCAAGAADGFRCLESGAFDLVILQEKPETANWDICSGIRQLTASPLIVISPGATAESCVKAIEAGADFFLRKPFGPMELMSRISVLFSRQPARQPVSISS
jgi:DNA-binding response OmpR family regulator